MTNPPIEVALIDVGAAEGPLPAVRGRDTPWRDYWYTGGPFLGSSQKRAVEGTAARRLLVLDPEDNDHMIALAVALHERGWSDADGYRVADAVRQLLDPKPDEPAGLGAVVVDREGERWVRTQPATGEDVTVWLGGRGITFAQWANIDAVTVKHPGVLW